MITSTDKFIYRGNNYNYLIHGYNDTALNERCVEVPIVLDWLLKMPRTSNILEFGNVVQNYYPDLPARYKFYRVIDKYEIGPNVSNVDIVDFGDNNVYDLVISISTLEHPGNDHNEEKDSEKWRRGLDRLKIAAAPLGQLIVTFPLGQNPGVDREFPENWDLHFHHVDWMKRREDGTWMQVGWNDVEKKPRPEGWPMTIGIGYWCKVLE